MEYKSSTPPERVLPLPHIHKKVILRSSRASKKQKRYPSRIPVIMFSDYTATRHSNHRKYRLWMHTTVISTYPVMMVHFLHFPSAPPFCLRMRLPPSNIQMNGAESCKVIALSKCFRSKGPEEIPLRANSKEEINEPTMVSWLFFFAVHRKRCVWRKNQHVGVFLQRKRHAQISSTSGLKPLS